jgi:hypothetical protein
MPSPAVVSCAVASAARADGHEISQPEIAVISSSAKGLAALTLVLHHQWAQM